MFGDRGRGTVPAAGVAGKGRLRRQHVHRDCSGRCVPTGDSRMHETKATFAWTSAQSGPKHKKYKERQNAEWEIEFILHADPRLPEAILY